MQFQDKGTIGGVTITPEGYLIADAFAVRTGIQKYAGYEVGRPDLAVVNVFRSAEEVFSADTLRSFSHTPVTNDHPAKGVDASNWGDLAVGEASTEVLRDGGRMKIPLIVKDQAAIADVQGGKRELSAGYGCDLVWADGVTPDGEAYQAKQVNIRANHIAIVQRGRAGKEFRIGDSADNWGAAPLTDEETPMTTRTVVVDGISILTTDQGAEAITKLNGVIDALRTELKTTTSAHATALSTKDGEIGQLKIELKTAQDAKPDAAAITKLVADRATLEATASKIAKDVKFDGLTDAEVRKAAVVAAFGEDMVKDASDDQIVGMFKAATKDGAGVVDPVRQVLVNRVSDAAPAGNGQAAYDKRIQDAWKGTPATAQ